MLLVCAFQFAMFSASQTVFKVLPLEMFDQKDEKVEGTYVFKYIFIYLAC